MNEILHIFILLFATLGATFIVNFSYIFKPIRERVAKKSKALGKLLRCPQCMGFWVGLTFESIIMLKMNVWQSLQVGDVYHLFYGFITSIFCYIVYLLIIPRMNKYD